MVAQGRRVGSGKDGLNQFVNNMVPERGCDGVVPFLGDQQRRYSQLADLIRSW